MRALRRRLRRALAALAGGDEGGEHRALALVGDERLRLEVDVDPALAGGLVDLGRRRGDVGVADVLGGDPGVVADAEELAAVALRLLRGRGRARSAPWWLDVSASALGLERTRARSLTTQASGIEVASGGSVSPWKAKARAGPRSRIGTQRLWLVRP